MSRTLSARTDLLKDRSYAAPIYLLKGELTAPGAVTLYLGNGALAAVNHVAAGQEWLPIILGFEDVESALETSSAGGAPGTFGATFSNAMPVGGKSRLSDLIRSNLNTVGSYVFTGSKWTLYEVLETAAGAPDLVTLGVFYVDGTPALGSRTVGLTFIDPSGYIDRRQVVTKIDTTNFPTADPDDVGKAIPRVFGSSVLNVGAVAAKAGGITFLTAPSAAGGGVSIISVYDASRFGATGSLRLGVDTYTYAKVSATSLRLVPTGTVPGPHPTGTFVIDVTTSFVYVVAENIGTGAGAGAHKHQAVSNVRSEKILQSPTINLDDTTLVSGKSFVTLTFAVPPGTVIQKSQDTASLPTSPKAIFTKYLATNISNAKITLAMTGVSSTKTGSYPISVQAGTPPGTVNAVRRTIRFRVLAAPATVTAWEIRRDSATGPLITSGTRLVVGETQPFTWGTGVTKGNQTIVFKVTGLTGTASLQIIEFFEEVESTIIAPTQGLTIADIIVGNVKCDVSGLQDDSAGTITGTPNTLLEIPADIAKLVMTKLYGIASADLGTTWATTRASQSAAGLKWAFVLGEQRFSELRARLGDQGQAIMFWDSGLCHYKYLTTAPVAGLTLAYGTDVVDVDDAGVNQTEATKIVNHLNAYWQRDYGKSGSLGDTYRQMQVFEDLTQVGFTDAIPEDLELDLITDTPTAVVIGTFLLGRRKRQRFEYNAMAVWNVAAVEQVDYIAVSGHPVLEGHGGVLLVFEVRRKRAMPSADNPGRVQLGLVEGNA